MEDKRAFIDPTNTIPFDYSPVVKMIEQAKPNLEKLEKLGVKLEIGEVAEEERNAMKSFAEVVENLEEKS